MLLLQGKDLGPQFCVLRGQAVGRVLSAKLPRRVQVGATRAQGSAISRPQRAVGPSLREVPSRLRYEGALQSCAMTGGS
jgi:hypothetical protein